MNGAIALLAFSVALVFWTGFGWMEHRSLEKKIRHSLRSGAPAARRWWRNKWRKKGLLEMPDFLDLLALGVSAGLTLDGAWTKALTYLPKTQLTGDLESFQHALRLGRTRRQAFSDLVARLDDPRLGMVFTLIEQAMSRGGSLQDILQDQARSLRQITFTALEKKAQTIGLRLLLPIFLFIFPTVFLILFAPLLIRASQGLPLF